LGEFFELCEKHKISVIVAGVYNSGILTSDPKNESFNYTQANKDIIKRKEAFWLFAKVIKYYCLPWQYNFLIVILK
jgi:aryl-alcohol dehydrogenase-like predicted oxidoreductase